MTFIIIIARGYFAKMDNIYYNKMGISMDKKYKVRFMLIIRAIINMIINYIKDIKNRRTILLCFGGILFIAAVVTFGLIYSEGNAAEQNAKELLSEYEAVIDEIEEQSAPTATAAAAAEIIVETIEGHEIMGKLVIEKIDLELPILAYMDDEALKVSICYYQGAMPGETGNLVITGHNYASNAHFGRLDELDEGDMIELSTPQGDIYMYQVYDKDKVTPDNKQVLDETATDTELTLLTCSSHGNRRLIVRCKLDI